MVSDDILTKATDWLVAGFHPQRIILFGSQARGNADEHSDVDLLDLSPVEDEEVTKEEAIRAIDIASHLRRIVRHALTSEVVGLTKIAT